MSVLPDYLAPELPIVFCGTAAGLESAKHGHCFAGPGNEFWRLLYGSGLLSERLRPQQDSRVLDFGFGLTDVAKNITASSDAGLAPHYDNGIPVAKIETYAPRWVAFHGKEAAKAMSRALGHGRNVALGRQSWMVAASHVFVLPSASGSNRNPNRLEGRTSRVDRFRSWRRRLADRSTRREVPVRRYDDAAMQRVSRAGLDCVCSMDVSYWTGRLPIRGAGAAL